MEENKQKNENEEAKESAAPDSEKKDFTIDAEETKSFLLEFFKNPINKIKNIANADNTYFKTAIILLIIWTVAELIQNLYYVVDFNNIVNFFRYGFFDTIFSVIMATIAPVLGILVLSLIILILNNERKKSLSSIIATVTLAKIPSILAAVLNILVIISSQVSRITGPITSLCYVISTVLLYFGIKELYQKEDDNSFIKTFVTIEAIYFAARFILTFMRISI